MMTGTEHEYSINSPGFVPLPESDLILGELAGRTVSEVPFGSVRSEERRVGKECTATCRSRWSPYH